MAEIDRTKFLEFLELHKPQLESSGVPEHLYPNLFSKITNETLDAGQYFMCVREEGDSGDVQWSVQLTAEEGLKRDDPNAIFLIDHAWTFRWNEAREQLEDVPGLLQRMMDITINDQSEEEQINQDEATASALLRKPSIVLLNHNNYDPVDKVLQSLWAYANTYSVQDPRGDAESRMPVWYIMDEFGCRVGHSNQPNMRVIPFLHLPTKICYSLMFPIRDIQCNEDINRNYAELCTGSRENMVDYHLLPWIPRDFSNENDDHLPVDKEFINQFREVDNLPESVPVLAHKSEITVYSDDEQLVKYITSKRVSVTNEPDKADVWWLLRHFKDYGTLAKEHPTTMINQFPCESCLTVKDLLAITVQSVYRHNHTVQYPNWFKRTYNLQNELPQFVAHFQKREKNCENTWIIKPWNLARGMDTYVTSNLTQIIRLVESGPKIACKYIENPVVFYRDDLTVNVKFDLRYIVMLKSVSPLQVYVYDRFWIRFARRAFCMDYLDDYDRHFTVFNYSHPSNILQMKCDDFIKTFEEQNVGINWSKDIEAKVYKGLKELFTTVTTYPPPRGLAHNPQSRAMYGVDVMLEWNNENSGPPVIEPVILEVNYMPDCTRACEYYPNFADTVFETLFLSDEHKQNVTLL